MAFTALYTNKLRSLLTMLGIIIGVGAVIAMVSVGMGVRSNVQRIPAFCSTCSPLWAKVTDRNVT